MSNHHKAKFTLSDPSNLDSLDIPGVIAKRKEKKYLNVSKGPELTKPDAEKSKTKQSSNDR